MKRFIVYIASIVVLGITSELLGTIQQVHIKQDPQGNSYIYVVAQTGLCGYLTLHNKLYEQLVLEAFLYDGNQEIKKIGRYEWHKPTDVVQFSFDSAGRSPSYHYRIYCYPRFGEKTDKSDCINLLVIDHNHTRTRAACTNAAPWAGGRGTIPFKPLCMDALYKSAECKENQ